MHLAKNMSPWADKVKQTPPQWWEITYFGVIRVLKVNKEMQEMESPGWKCNFCLLYSHYNEISLVDKKFPSCNMAMTLLIKTFKSPSSPQKGGAGVKIRKYYPKPSFLNEYSTHSFSCPMQPAWQRNSQQPLTWLCPLSPWEFVCTVSHFSHVWLCATLWMVTCQAPLSVGFSRQEYWSGWPCPSPGDLPDPGIEPESLMPLALASGFFTTSAT